MRFAKRIFLFLAINFLVVLTISALLNIFHVQPFLNAHGIDYRSLLIFCLLWGMGGALISLSLSRVMAKWMMGVHLIDTNTHDSSERLLIATIEKLAQQSGLPMPQVGIYESPEVNAFATGPSKKRALVAVSRGLLNRMAPDELEGVLAHELSHIANGDMVTMTLIQGIVNAFVMFLARILAFVVSGMGKNRQSSSSSSGGSYVTYIMMVYLFEIVFMILGSILIAWFSRQREYRADKGGARLSGKEKMIAALQSLKAVQERRDQKAEKPAFQTMKISTPGKSGFLLLFSTHPPLERRIERLQRLNTTLE